MKYQHMAQTAVQENNMEMRILAWEKMLPYYFYFNETNYTRYGTYYIQQWCHLETLYPGMKPLLEVKGISVSALRTLTLYKRQLIHVVNRPLIEMPKLHVRHMVLQCTGSV